MVATVRPIPGQSDEDFFELVYLGRARGGHYKPDEYAAWLKRRTADIANAVRDPAERIAELLAANTALVDRARAAEARVGELEDKVDGLDSDYTAAKSKIAALEDQKKTGILYYQAWCESQLHAGRLVQRWLAEQTRAEKAEARVGELQAEIDRRDRRVQRLGLDPAKLEEAQRELQKMLKDGAVGVPPRDTPMSSDWRDMPAPSDTDPRLLSQKEIDDLLGFNAPTCPKCGADRQMVAGCTAPDCPPMSNVENPPTEVYIEIHRFVPEAALNAEKMANAQLFECLWNIKRVAKGGNADPQGALVYIYEVANAAAPDAPAKPEGDDIMAELLKELAELPAGAEPSEDWKQRLCCGRKPCTEWGAARTGFQCKEAAMLWRMDGPGLRVRAKAGATPEGGAA